MSEKVVITGASSGIGRAAAHAFASEGSELFLVARREDRLANVVEECRSRGSLKTFVGTWDLSVAGEGTKVVQAAVKTLGGLDVLVCNAGYGFWGPVDEVPAESMARMWQVNVQSAYESILAALPHFKGQQKGYIVLVSSIIGKKAMPYSASYCATKFAQVGLGEALNGELKEDGVGVSVICPGYTDTEFHEVARPGSGFRLAQRPLKGQDPTIVGRAILKAVRSQKREVHLTAGGKAILFIDRISNSLATWIMRLVAERDHKIEK